MRAFQMLIADLGFEAAAMITFPDTAGRNLPLPWGFRELGRRIRQLGFAAAMASDLPRRLRSRLRPQPSAPLLKPPPIRWPSPEPTWPSREIYLTDLRLRRPRRCLTPHPRSLRMVARRSLL